MNSPIPWMGSKRRLASKILPILPPHTCYVEPFAGSAALLFARDQPAKVEVLNDIDRELVNLFRVLKHHLQEFVQQFRWALSSRAMFEWARETPPEVLTDIQRAARFYYLQKLCFGGRPTGRTLGVATTTPPSLNLLRIEEELSAVHLRLSRVLIEELPWQRCIERYDRAHTVFFLEPPYLGTAGYGHGDWGIESYEELANSMRTISGKAILTINERDDIRRVFAGFRVGSTKIRYSVGDARTRSTERTELIIQSW